MTLSGEVEAMGDIFGRMNRQCYEKCIGESVRSGTAYENELGHDEEQCLINCATKFVRVLPPTPDGHQQTHDASCYFLPANLSARYILRHLLPNLQRNGALTGSETRSRSGSDRLIRGTHPQVQQRVMEEFVKESEVQAKSAGLT